MARIHEMVGTETIGALNMLRGRLAAIHDENPLYMNKTQFVEFMNAKVGIIERQVVDNGGSVGEAHTKSANYRRRTTTAWRREARKMSQSRKMNA